MSLGLFLHKSTRTCTNLLPSIYDLQLSPAFLKLLDAQPNVGLLEGARVMGRPDLVGVGAMEEILGRFRHVGSQLSDELFAVSQLKTIVLLELSA